MKTTVNLCLTLIAVVATTHGLSAQVKGCNDPLASNYNSAATVNDGSCSYTDSGITPLSGLSLVSALAETSGLVRWNNQVWTHNDSGDNNLYGMDTTSGAIIKTQPLTGKVNTDWEDIAQDQDFIYVGDFGNNGNGNRTDLKIFKISKFTLLLGNPLVETINFSYSNQTSLNATGANNTDFDCEALIVSSDSIYLFTKQWVSEKTSVYRLSKSPGTQVAKLKATYDVKGLVTGATYLQEKQVIGLCGYSKQLQPFIFLMYDFKGVDFFGGNKRKVSVSLPFTQVEGIATNNGLRWYLSNEAFVQGQLINTPQKLHVLDLNPLLGRYLGKLITGLPSAETSSVDFFPNPASDGITIDSPAGAAEFRILDTTGKPVIFGIAPAGRSYWNIDSLVPGLYLLKVAGDGRTTRKLIRR